MVTITKYFEFSTRYNCKFCFYSPPVFSFEDTKGLSDEDLKTLKREIMTQADELCGEVKTKFDGSSLFIKCQWRHLGSLEFFCHVHFCSWNSLKIARTADFCRKNGISWISRAVLYIFSWNFAHWCKTAMSKMWPSPIFEKHFFPAKNAGNMPFLHIFIELFLYISCFSKTNQYRKTKVMLIEAPDTPSVSLNNTSLEDAESFIYLLGSVIWKDTSSELM